MNTYIFNITGMTCHACESLIAMDLEDADLPAPTSINAETGEMQIVLEADQVDRVKETIAASEKYTVESVTTMEV